MATIYSQINMMNKMGLLSSNTMRAVQELNALSVQLAPSIQETYRVTSQLSAILTPSLLEAARRAQEIANLISLAVMEFATISAQWANLMTPGIQTAVESLQRLGITLQPLLVELHEVSPTAEQFANLYQAFSVQTQTIELTADAASDIETLSQIEMQEVSQAVSGIIAKPENWEQKLARTLQEMKEQHPVYAEAILCLLSAIITIMLSVAANYIYDTIKTTRLREAPSTDAPVVAIIPASRQVSAVGNEPYYFQVEYTDPETGVLYTGWLSKRSLQEHEEEIDAMS